MPSPTSLRGHVPAPAWGFAKRESISWGDASQVACELRLIDSAFWSISGEFARWIMEREDMVRERFCSRTLCCDEVFMQALLLSSPFVGQLREPGGDELAQSARLIDWTRPEGPEGSSPHTWRMGDWDLLASAEDRMFARKFDQAIDAEVIERLTAHVLGCDSDTGGLKIEG